MHPRLAVLLLAIATSSLSAQTSRGIQLFKSSDWAAAKSELSAAVKRDDRDAPAHYYLGRLALLDGDADEAADHLERAVKLDDNSSEYHLWYANAIRQQTLRASVLQQMILGPRLKSEYERAVALDARNIDARDVLADLYAMAPAAMGGSPEKAREQAHAIARVDPMRGHLALARIAAQAKDSATVERETNAAIAAAPDSLRGYTVLANWYASEKKWAQAFATIDRYIKRRPDDLYGPNAIGRFAATSGLELARGEQGLRAFIARPPKDAGAAVLSRAHQRLGQILEQEGKHTEARAALEQALKIDPRNEDAKKALRSMS